MQAGKLRNYVQVEAETYSSIGTRGKPVRTWSSLYADVPARIEFLSGRELELARQIVPTAQYRITMRYKSGITNKHSITHGGIRFNIESVNNVEMRNLELVLICSDGVIDD